MSNNWNGEGLPTVGTTCNAFYLSNKFRVEVLKVFESKGSCACLVLDSEFGHLSLRYFSEFEPIKSDRDKAVEEMMDIWRNWDVSEKLEGLFGRFFDAGFKKQSGE